MKAILVIDEMPKNCDGCPLERWGIDGWNCTPMNRMIEDDKPDWCPLKPLPTEKKPDNPDERWEEMHMRFGWNDCLKEIEGD